MDLRNLNSKSSIQGIFVRFCIAITFISSLSCGKAGSSQNSVADDNTPNMMDDFDPYAPDAADKLKQMDKDYQEQTGKSAFIVDDKALAASTCRQSTCSIWAQIDKDSQTMHLYVKGQLQGTWKVSTGVPGHGTPDFETHPDGRIYDAYTSTHYPGGDYNGLGNMPYAVFIQGGFAIHGTGKANWPHLGHVASHGCIRLLPDNAFIFNRLVRQYGVADTWVSVH